MVSGIWRWLRSALRSASAERSAISSSQLPSASREPVRSAPPAPTAPLDGGSADAPTPSLAELARSLGERLAEDEALRSHLSDQAFAPLLDWSLQRVDRLAERCAAAAPDQAAACFQAGQRALLELLRVADLAIGERSANRLELVQSRLQMLDTFLEPPLFAPDEAAAARRRLATLLAEAPALADLADADLAHRVIEALG